MWCFFLGCWGKVSDLLCITLLLFFFAITIFFFAINITIFFAITLRTLTKRAHIVCSNDTLLESELQHLMQTFHKINGYPKPIINQVFKNVKQNFNTPRPTLNNLSITPSADLQQDETTTPTPSTHLLIVPYKGKNWRINFKRHEPIHQHHLTSNHSHENMLYKYQTIHPFQHQGHYGHKTSKRHRLPSRMPQTNMRSDLHWRNSEKIGRKI